MRRVLLGILLLIVTGTSIGCVRKPLKMNDLAGTWVGTDIHGHPLTPPATPTIELHSDGNFSARNIPASSSELQPPAGSGKWTLPVEGSQQRLLLVFASGQQGVPSGGYGMSLSLERHAGQYLIIEYLGDPDDGQAIAFVKK